MKIKTIDIARALKLQGYNIIPIKANSKLPAINGWQKHIMTDENIETFFAAGKLGIGILHSNTGCIDIDVYDPPLAQEILQEALRRLPGGLVKVGQYPKSAVIFARPEAPMPVRNTGRYTKHSLAGCVEIRTAGASVVYGIHPVTMEPYSWPLGELYDKHISELPCPPGEELQSFRDWADDRLADWAGAKKKPASGLKQGGRTGPVIDTGGFTISTDETPPEDEVLAALEHVSPNMQHDEWVRVLMGLHDYYNGSQRGLQVAKDWSSPYPNYNSQEVEAKWRSFQGQGVKYQTIFQYAKEAGADLSEIKKRHSAKSFDSYKRESKTEDDSNEYIIDVYRKQPPDALQRRKWIYGGVYVRGYLSLLAAPGGIGKSSLAIAEAIAIASGNPLLNIEVGETTRVWIVNLEDDKDEMQKRIQSAQMYHGVDDAEIDGRIFFSAEDTISICVAMSDGKTVVKNQPVVEKMINTINRNGIGVVIIDPFVSLHEVNENSNSEVQIVMRMLREVARRSNASVVLVHHHAKGGRGGQDAVRGAGSLSAGARCVRNLIKSDENYINLTEEEKAGAFMVVSAKSNMTAAFSSEQHLTMVNYDLQCVDGIERVGVVKSLEPPEKKEIDDPFEEVTASDAIEVQRLVEEAANAKDYYMARRNSKKPVHNAILEVLGLKTNEVTMARADAIYKTWKRNKVLKEVKIQLKGQPRLCVVSGEKMSDKFTPVEG